LAAGAGAACCAASAAGYSLLKRPRASADAPQPGQKMRRLVLVEADSDFNKVKIQVEETEIPKPKPGEVLVRVAAAPVNPSDYGVWKRHVGPPKGIGNECAGVVVASGGGAMAGQLLGKTVGVLPSNGSYSEYVVASVLDKVYKLDGVSAAEACSFFVNPYTAVGIVNTVKNHRCKAFIHTAAASQLGKMLVKLAPSMGVTVVNVVRKQEQVDALKQLGAEYVVNQSEEDWEKQLKGIVDSLKIRVAFECIGGDMPGRLASLMPSQSTVYVYGALSQQPVGGIPPIDMIYREQVVRGWLLPKWLQKGGVLQTVRRVRWATKLVSRGLQPGGWASTAFLDCKLENMQAEFLKMWNGAGFTDAKLRILMGS